MANTTPQLLNLANTTTSTLNFQIPTISIKLERENYSLWRTTIVSALETFDLEGFIFDPNPPPERHVIPATDGDMATTEPNPDFATWKKRDRFVLLWLKSTLSERALAIVARSTSSQMAWQTIEKTFQAQTRARRMSMKVQLQSLSKGSMSMMEYIERKRSIADSLAENLNPIFEEDLIGHLLNGLDSSYGAFTAALMMKTDAVSVDDLAGLLLQEEARLEQELVRQAAIQSPIFNSSAQQISGSSALTVHRSNNKSGPSPISHKSGSSSASHSFEHRRRRPICQLCNKPGHEAIDCWQRSNQTDFPSRRPTPKNQTRQANVVQHVSPSTVVDPSWYFDTGATDHVSPDIHKLNITEDYNGGDKLQVGNGQNNSQRGC